MSSGLGLNIGFTGTRQGLTIDQSASLRYRLSRPQTSWTMFSQFHHGDCVGADEEAHDMMRILNRDYWPLRVDIYIHPPIDFRFRAMCGIAETRNPKLMAHKDLATPEHVVILPEKKYADRNRDIVRSCDVLIACPREGVENKEVGRSGTWLTIRMARHIGRKIIIIWPDGSVTRENWDLTHGDRVEMREKDAEVTEG